MNEPTYIAGILQKEALGRGQVFWLNKPKDGTHLYTHPVNVTYELTMEKCRQQQAEIEALKEENQALKLCETNYPLEKHSKEWFQQQLARSDKIIFIERKLASEKLDEYRKTKEQVKKKQEIIERQQAEIEALKEALQAVITISAWDKAKELLK